jgi:hypothetical protein
MAFITIDRKLFNHFLWTERRPRTKFEAWLDLIRLVSFDENNELLINNNLVKWGRGEYPISYTFLSKRWIWSIQKVRCYLTLLKNNRQINTKTTGQTTILILCNYDQYNPKQQGKRQSKKQDQIQTEGIATAPIKEIKELNNSNKYSNIPPSIEEIKIRMEERNITSFTAEYFYSHYESNGWMVGKVKMKNWDSSLTYWNSNRNFKNNGEFGKSHRTSGERTDSYWN